MAYERTWQPAKSGPRAPSSWQDGTQYVLWAIAAFLLGKSGFGSPGESSKWTVIGSSDGTNGALDGVDRIGSTYNGAVFPLSSGNGTAHGWIVLKSPSPGWNGLYVYMLLSACQYGGSIGQACIVLSNAVFTGGSNTTDPTTTGNSWGTSATFTTVDPGGITLDNRRYYCNISSDGSFWFVLTRAGYGEMFLAVVNPVGCKASDAYPVWGFQAGSGTANVLAQNFGLMTTSTMKAVKSAGGANWFQGLVAPPALALLDSVDTSLFDWPAWVLVCNTSTLASVTGVHARGRLPDMGIIAAKTDGAAPVSLGNTIKDDQGIVRYATCGQMILPFNDVLV